MIKILLCRLRQVNPTQEIEKYTVEQVPKANSENLTVYLLLKGNHNRITTLVRVDLW